MQLGTQHRPLLLRLVAGFADVSSLSVEGWEATISRQRDAEAELALWLHALWVYESVCEGDALSHDERRGLFSVLVAMMSAPRAVARQRGRSAGLSDDVTASAERLFFAEHLMKH